MVGIINFNNSEYGNLGGWGHGTKVMLLYSDVPFILSRFKRGPIGAIKWRSSGDNLCACIGGVERGREGVRKEAGSLGTFLLKTLILSDQGPFLWTHFILITSLEAPSPNRAH